MKQIELPKLPNGWDALTPEQMVQLNRIRKEHGISKENFMLQAFCYLLDIRLITAQKNEQDEYVYIFQQNGKEEQIPLEAWEIQFFIDEQLKWLTEDSTRLLDVFPILILRGKKFGSPGYAMAGMTYQQYKKTQDCVILHHRITGQLVDWFRKSKDGLNNNDKVTVENLLEELKKVKGKFLACVYSPETEVKSRIVDGQSITCNPPEKAYVFSPNQITTYAEWFEDIPDEKTEAIMQLFSGVMINYRKMFPLLFPEKAEENKKPSNFIQVESATMNALQAKLNFNNYQTIYDSNAPFILEKLNAMLKEGKELDEQRRKMKAKR